MLSKKAFTNSRHAEFISASSCFIKQGFTLIELLVVVLIVGILVSVAVPQYQKAVAKTKLSQALMFAKTLKNAEEWYYLANGVYTVNLEALPIDIGEYSGSPHQSGNSIKVTQPNYNVEVSINGYGSDNNRVTIYLRNDQSLLHGIVYYLDVKGYTRKIAGVLCFGENDIYKQACVAMGGVRKGFVGGRAFAYQLP